MPFDTALPPPRPETSGSIVALLVAARASIADRGDWLQGRMVSHGHACAVGAVWRLAQRQFYSLGVDRFTAALALLHAALPPYDRGDQDYLKILLTDKPCLSIGTTAMISGVAQYNDTHSHEEVLALYDRAIIMADLAALGAAAAPVPG